MKSLGLPFPDHSAPGFDKAVENLGAIVESAHTPQGAFGYLLSQIDPRPQLAVPVHFTLADDTVECAYRSVRNHFPKVKIIVRPEHLRADDIPMNEVLAHDIGQLEADYYVQSHSTNPQLRPATISDAITKFLGSREEHDSLFSVTRLQTKLYDQHGRAINHDPSVVIQTQDLPPV